jgi:hypothetical protein
LKGACPVWSGGKAERPNLSLPERQQEGRGESLNFTFEAGRNSQPSVNERNASSPWKRLVLNSVKREENRVPPDSNGISLGAGTYGQATNTRLNGRHHHPASAGVSAGSKKDKAWGWASRKVTQVHPRETRKTRVALRVRKTNVRNEVTPAVSRKSRCQPDDGRGGIRPRSKGRG